MAWLKENYNPDHIWFADDIIGLKPGWMQEFAGLVESRNISIPFKCLSRADLLLVDDAVSAFQKAGCQTIWIGAESGAQKILDAMEKGTTVEQIYEATRRLHTAGIKVAFFIQFGYPGETRDDIEKTLKMIRECQPDDIGISVSYPLPGTKFYDRVKDQMTSKQNWQDSEDLAMLYQGPFTTEFYRTLHMVAHKEFRHNKFLSEVKTVMMQPATIRPIHFKRLLMAYYYKLSLPGARLRLRMAEKIKHKPTILTEPSG
jgi:anaerobic magnesium-protoporphyrin IX monomethyl ester cyclase